MTEEEKRILIADDEPGLRDMYHFLLEPLGYQVVTVEDGAAAVDRFESSRFDLVILDVHMPGMTGPEALARIRRLRPEQRVIVVSSSSDVNQTFEKRIHQETGIECLFKPMSLDELTAAVEGALSAGDLDEMEEGHLA